MTRANQATVIDGQLRSLMEIVNRRYQDVPLFAGHQFGDAGDAVFIERFGGVQYTGSTTDLAGDVGLLSNVEFTTDGLEALGALSSRVRGSIDLSPQLTGDTHLNDLRGAQGQGIRRGSLFVNVDGTQVTVDLTTADTADDVVGRINAAIESVSPGAGQLAIDTNGFTLASNGATITISDPTTGQVAADLGIVVSASGGTVAGVDVGRRLTHATELAALGAAVDFAAGLSITQGAVTKVADFSSAQTVQDLVNVVEQLNLGLRLEVNAEGTGLDLVTSVSGVELAIRENGGTTAADLGLPTFGPDTRLDELNHGLGVPTVPGEDDLAVVLHDGTTFNINLDTAVTASDVVALFEQAASDAGVAVPGTFSIAIDSAAGGFVLTDNTTGTLDFRVKPVGASTAVEALGILAAVGDETTIAGDDVSTVRVESVLTHLMELRDALRNNDERGITFAGSSIESDIDALARARADVGVRAQRAEQQQNRNSELTLLDQNLLSDLRDADLTEVITRFTAMQQQLQATLQVGASNLQLSLLDFLR